MSTSPKPTSPTSPKATEPVASPTAPVTEATADAIAEATADEVAKPADTKAPAAAAAAVAAVPAAAPPAPAHANPKVNELAGMFPTVDTGVIEMVLESVGGSQDRAIESLLQMTDPEFKPDTSAQPVSEDHVSATTERERAARARIESWDAQRGAGGWQETLLASTWATAEQVGKYWRGGDSGRAVNASRATPAFQTPWIYQVRRRTTTRCGGTRMRTGGRMAAVSNLLLRLCALCMHLAPLMNDDMAWWWRSVLRARC